MFPLIHPMHTGCPGATWLDISKLRQRERTVQQKPHKKGL